MLSVTPMSSGNCIFCLAEKVNPVIRPTTRPGPRPPVPPPRPGPLPSGMLNGHFVSSYNLQDINKFVPRGTM